jgi:hypothetical protein
MLGGITANSFYQAHPARRPGNSRSSRPERINQKIGVKMKSIKCSNCGLTNWSTVEACKRCGASLMSGEQPFDSRPHETAYYGNEDNRQFANYPSPLQDKKDRLVLFGALLIILGGIITALHVGASMRGASVPLYFLVLGLSVMASGVVFCMKEWAAVYVYFAGFGLALLTMFLTEGTLQKPVPRLGGPVVLGLFLLNKMLKAKKAASVQYAGPG